MKKKTVALLVGATFVVSCFLTLVGLFALLGIGRGEAKELARFFGALRFIESQYVQDVNYEALMDGAIDGMVKTLGDPHSIYLDQKNYKMLQEQTEGSFGGIGVVLGFKDHKATIMAVLEGTPSEKAGLAAGDEILAIDDTKVQDIQPEEVAMKIRGEIGTKVTLKIRNTEGQEKDVTVERATIQVKTVAGEIMPQTNGIGYIRISSFSERTAEEFKQTYDKLAKDGMKGLILDLRGNPGGLVSSCVDVAQMLVPKGPIVSVVKKDGSKETYSSSLETEKYPIVVLIDGNSASAAEILAGALQDTQAATLVGAKSYGKGSVQSVLPLMDDDALKLTIAKYYTPNGRSIDGEGIEPDVPVALPDPPTADTQLQKAVEVLKGKMGS